MRRGRVRLSALAVGALAFTAAAPTAVQAARAPGPASAEAFVFPYQDKKIVVPKGRWAMSQGVDIATVGGACGDQAVVVATDPGKVVREGVNALGPDTPVIQVTGGPRAGRSIYYGSTKGNLVPVGAQVQAGQPITHVGCGPIGMSSTPHLEIGMSLPGGPTCCPGVRQTSPELYNLLAAAY
jgi:murein DD-endopeptidase MepM/ murein hydrolase activator NlpD